MFCLRTLCLAALGAWAVTAGAQEGSGTSGGSGAGSSSSAASSAGASSSFGALPSSSSGGGSSAFGGAESTGPLTPLPAAGAGSSATGFGTGIGTGTPAQSGQPTGTEIPGFGAGGVPAAESPTTFSISSGFGRAPEVFVSGEGRLARPRFAGRVSSSIGFDDNVFQTPFNAQGTPDTVIEQQISEGTPDQVVLVPIPDTRPRRIGVISPPRQQRFRQVVIPGREPEFETIVIPGTPKPKRQVSAITRLSLNWEAQLSTRRSLFTADFNVNADYFWNRPRTKEEYNGSLALRYLHRVSRRLELTASLDVNYLSQPDFSQINTPTSTGNGNFLVVNAKSDLSYRWTPRISTVVSLAYNQLSFMEPRLQFGDFSQITLGASARYLWTPRLTAVVEGRYAQSYYPNAEALNASTVFALVGADISLSRRASATVRIGQTVRSFDQGGETTSAPYLEATLNYQLGRASALTWNNRFGFEEPPSPTAEVLSLRSSLAVTHFFGPRLRGSLSMNANLRRVTDNATDLESNEASFESSLSLLYTLSRFWTFNLNYNYTAILVDPAETDFFRNRIFTGFDYAF